MKEIQQDVQPITPPLQRNVRSIYQYEVAQKGIVGWLIIAVIIAFFVLVTLGSVAMGAGAILHDVQRFVGSTF